MSSKETVPKLDLRYLRGLTRRVSPHVEICREQLKLLLKALETAKQGHRNAIKGCPYYD